MVFNILLVTKKVKLLNQCVLLQMNAYIKYFENGGKNMSSVIKVIMYYINTIKIGTRLKRH